MFYFHPQKLNNYAPYTFYTPEMGGLNKKECEKVLSIWDEKQAGQGITGQNADSLLTHLPSEKRQSRVQWIEWSNDTDWLFKRLSEIALACNGSRYGFQLNGFLESLQLTEYQESDHYDWHTDHGNGEFSVRKLSMVVQLSDPKDYEGGSLQVHEIQVKEKEQGTVVLFPSFSAHKVHPVQSGKRYSLVAWLTGEPFR
jgi:PKHD-type hydroxylase